MALWFCGMSLVLAWNIFRDPALDLRLVMAGAVLPDLVDGATGAAGVLHSLAGAAALLGLVMVATIRRRRLRRRLLALSIGVFFHLLLDGAWASDVFWWPATGWDLGDEPLPSFDRPTWMTVAMEVAGAVALLWAYRRFGLADAGRRRLFLRQGRLDPAVTGATPPASAA